MNYKGYKAGKVAKHEYLYAHYGRPLYCTNKKCEKKSKRYEWCKIRGRKYTHNPKDYIWLCQSCHRRYDMTERKRRLAIKNLSWSNGKSRVKLNEQKVRDIRTRLKKGEIMYRLAKEYGVDKTTIRDIRDYQVWRNI